ncbi:MAG: ribonuclease PH [Victivallales bacterium]|nr:ribonuclease PH [Victivallales bacterium]
MSRLDGRRNNELRPLAFVPDYQLHPLGSVLAVCGRTRVVCAVSVENAVPSWMKAQGVSGGWITAEYQMLPSATNTRSTREVTKGKLSGRSAEIQRLIGRSLRAVVDLEKLPGITLHVDCDVIDADGGTRCASITGACAALERAAAKLVADGTLAENPIKARVAAVSVGIVNGEPLLDLCYEEDSAAEVDMNVVMTSAGRFVELQGTGEEATFDDGQLASLLALARQGLAGLFAEQERIALIRNS